VKEPVRSIRIDYDQETGSLHFDGDLGALEAFLEQVKRRTLESFNAVSRPSDTGRLGTLPKPRRIDIP